MRLISVKNFYGADRILFALLQERTEDQSISHKEMPTYEKHCEFVSSDPYRGWFMILNEHGLVVGTIYITEQNEIGIQIFTDSHGKGYGKKAVQIIMGMYKGPFLANINPKNQRSIQFFEGFGFKHIQNTYASS